jgi:DNA-dependent RNA polymerase
MTTEFEPSFDRVWRGEKHKAEEFGFGGTQQAQAVARHCRVQLAANIALDRAQSRNKPVLRALTDLDDDTLALNLMAAGISVAQSNELGADRDGHKNLRDLAYWIGGNFQCRGEIAVRVGVWAIELLRELPVFGMDGEILKLTAAADEIMDEALARAVKNNALLAPLDTPPAPWMQVNKGGLPDDWARVSLIRDCHPSIERAVRNAIGKEEMRGVLDAINALQSVPFCINEPVLKFMLQMGAPPAPRGEKPKAWQKKRFEGWMDAFNRVTEWDTDTLTATLLAAADRFWVPLNIDFRGRIYGIPHFNIQRHDRVRGLFLFANGKPIGVEGLRWLKAHVARTANGNTWSREPRPGDLDLEGRIAWTDDNLPLLCQIGEAVERADVTIAWALPKDRYQFAAACVELVQAMRKGTDFVTRLPIMFDASCSGQQHMLAIMRAKSGRYVNIVSSAKPAFEWTDEDGVVRTEPAEDMGEDFYRRVAVLVFYSGVKEYFSLSHWGMFLLEVAPILMKDQFDREIIKPAAVAEFYGSRAGGWKDGPPGLA